MLDNNEIALVLVRDANLVQEELGRLAHDHGTEELATEPGATTRRNASLDNGNLEVGALGCERECSREATRASTDNDNVRLSVSVKVTEVAAGHGTRDLRLADGSKGEGLPVVLELSDSLGLAVDGGLDS